MEEKLAREKKEAKEEGRTKRRKRKGRGDRRERRWRRSRTRKRRDGGNEGHNWDRSRGGGRVMTRRKWWQVVPALKSQRQLQ